MIELLCTDYNKKATSIHYYFGNAVLGIWISFSYADVRKRWYDHSLSDDKKISAFSMSLPERQSGWMKVGDSSRIIDVAF